jgi:hypothetical protein
VNYLNSTPRPEIKLVVSENEDRSIGIYGQRRTSQRVASAVFRFEFQGSQPQLGVFGDSSYGQGQGQGQLMSATMPAIRTNSVKYRPGSSSLNPNNSSNSNSQGKMKQGSKTVGHVNAVAELRQNSASYSIKMSASLSGESAATELRKERSMNV